MAAQKLTQARLVQIMFMMALLISAFIWRTVEYKQTSNVEPCDFRMNICTLAIDGARLTIQKETLSKEIYYVINTDKDMNLEFKTSNNQADVKIKVGKPYELKINENDKLIDFKINDINVVLN